MKNTIPSCYTYLATLQGKGKGFLDLAQIKTKSIIYSCGQSPDLDNDSFLILNPSIIPDGMMQLSKNIDMTVVDHESWFNLDLPENVKVHGGELADFAAQGIQFDYVIAPDEWITFADSELEQQQMLSMISKVTRKGFFTTLKDYKNMYANQRYFEEPFVLRHNQGDAIIIRQREWDSTDRQRWINNRIIIRNDEVIRCTPNARRTMYFKQMAKFCTDVGATAFSVEKDNMYKPPFSKTFEYVIFVEF